MLSDGAARYGRGVGLDYLSFLHTETTRFGAVLRDTDPAARVPSCPDWDVDDLLWHLSDVLLFWGAVVRNRLANPTDAEAAKPPRPASHADLMRLYDQAAAELCDALAATPDDVAVWTWSSNHTVGFIRRRMAHEALIHRLDAELATDSVSDFDADLATDGVSEMLEYFFGDPSWATFEPDGPIGRLRTIDTRTEWLVQVGVSSGTSPSGNSYQREPSFQRLDSGSPSVTVSASARDLDAWIWNRPTLAPPTVEGSGEDYHALLAVVAPGG
jgi:uncharacterized protein (TIGR03083 family)